AGLEPLEALIRRTVKEHVGRGHLEITISLEESGTARLEINQKLVQAYAAACQKLRNDYGFTGQPDPMALLRIPGVVTAGDGDISSSELERIQRVLVEATLEALRQLNQMRAREGEALERDLRERLDRLQELCAGVQALSKGFAPLYQRRLENRVSEISRSVGVDAGRVAQEVAYLMARSDIAEELTRFR